MSGTGYKCKKCSKIFRVIHGMSTEELHKIITEDERTRFFGEEYLCCGEVESLFQLGMKDEVIELQGEWLRILARLHEKNPSMFTKIQSVRGGK